MTREEFEIAKFLLMYANADFKDLSFDDFKQKMLEIDELDEDGRDVRLAVLCYALGKELQKGGDE